MYLSAPRAEELQGQRWFAGKGRPLAGIEWIDTAPLDALLRWELVRIRYADGGDETYALLRQGEQLDVLRSSGVAERLLALLREEHAVSTARGGVLHLSHTPVLDSLPPQRLVPSRLLLGEQSNSSLVFGDGLVLKLFRRPQEGMNPELEITRLLTERTTFRHAPLLAGAAEYRSAQGQVMTCAVLETFVPNRGDAWSTTLSRLSQVVDGADMSVAVQPMQRLGEVTAELHLALASVRDDPAFVPAPVVQADLTSWIGRIQEEIQAARAELEHAVVGRTAPSIDWVALQARAEGLRALSGTWKTRHHGDDHLGQALETGSGDMVVIDFEGEPARPLEERRERRPPLRDVAGLLRSLDYARHAALRALPKPSAAQRARADAWHLAARAALLAGYLQQVRPTRQPLVPQSEAGLRQALRALEGEKAVYELMYELRNRPDWVAIPLAALAE